MKLAIVGVTGMVGGEILKVLDDFIVDIDEFYPVASERSAGKTIFFREKEHKILNLSQALEKEIDIVIFSAGALFLWNGRQNLLQKVFMLSIIHQLGECLPTQN